MRGSLILAEYMTTPWAVMPERLEMYSAVLLRWARGDAMPADVAQQVAADKVARDNRRQANVRAAGGAIAVLPMYGVLTQRGNMMDAISGPGSTSTEMFTDMVNEAVNDDAVGSILIDIDSPGGSVYGIPELAQVIYDARQVKPVVAVANSLAASAAYWLGSQASEFYMTPGGDVGSIGAYTVHQDISEALAEDGIKMTVISAGKYKAETTPYAPLSDEARAFTQARVDEYYADFIGAVARGRGVDSTYVLGNMGQGRAVGAAQALSSKMVDGVKTFSQVVAMMQKRAAQSAPVKPSSTQRAQRVLRTMG